MNNRSGAFKFFILLLLVVIIVLQILAVVQSNRLYKRLNHLLQVQKNFRAVKNVQGQ